MCVVKSERKEANEAKGNKNFVADLCKATDGMMVGLGIGVRVPELRAVMTKSWFGQIGEINHVHFQHQRDVLIAMGLQLREVDVRGC